jgi:hypothetical protein
MPRRVILGFGISIDGYIARRNGAMDYLVIDYVPVNLKPEAALRARSKGDSKIRRLASR